MGRNAPRFSRERCASEITAACAMLGVNTPNGAWVESLSGVTRRSSMKRRMHSAFWRLETGLSTSLRAQRSNPSIPTPRRGLLRCARNDGSGDRVPSRAEREDLRRLLGRFAVAQEAAEQAAFALARDQVDVAD